MMSTHSRRLGKYELQERLGRGGMAEVWKAFDTQLKRYVAVKILLTDLQSDSMFLTRFEREAQVIAALRHPNIVHIYDFHVSHPTETENPTTYMVMDYIEGQTLADYIRNTSRAGKIPPQATIVNLFFPICQAIDYAHRQGMIHRDIKPANILLDKHNTAKNPTGEPILTDFGIAKLLRSSSNITSGWQIGTPMYVSPEQAMGSAGDERSDIYPLGVMLYEIFTGVLPFQGDTPVAVMAQHVNTIPISPALINPQLPPALTMVILRALAKDPGARFPTASSLAVALAEALNVPVPGDLRVPTVPSEAMYSPTHISQRFQQPSGMTPAFTSLPTVGTPHPSQPMALATPQFVPPSSSEQGVPTTPAGSIPAVFPLAQSNPQLPVAPSNPHLPLVTPAQPPGVTPLPSSSRVAPAPTKRWRWLTIGLIAAFIIVLMSSGLGAFFLLPRGHTTGQQTNHIVGHAFFISSEQVSETTSGGITDELQIDLYNVPAPAAGKSYYGWLEADTINTMGAPILLGKLDVVQGQIHHLYPGDAHHTNLLALTSRFLVTEEDSGVLPNIPSPDKSTWRYYAQFPQPTASMDASQSMTGIGMEQLGVTDHLRHLLSEAPELRHIGLTGGLDIWLFRNSEKVLEWSVSARDDWQVQATPFIHRQVIRILDYLDGLSSVQQDAPGQPVQVTPVNARIALLDVNPQLQVRGFLYTIDLHLNGVIQSPGATPEQRSFATQIDTAIKNVEVWLANVRKDAQQLEPLSLQQLLQPAALAILDDMANQSLYAFAGRIDPTTGNVQEGVIQIHYNIQRLATFDVRPYMSN